MNELIETFILGKIETLINSKFLKENHTEEEMEEVWIKYLTETFVEMIKIIEEYSSCWTEEQLTKELSKPIDFIDLAKRAEKRFGVNREQLPPTPQCIIVPISLN